jgi:hypothetical protein
MSEWYAGNEDAENAAWHSGYVEQYGKDADFYRPWDQIDTAPSPGTEPGPEPGPVPDIDPGPAPEPSLDFGGGDIGGGGDMGGGDSE